MLQERLSQLASSSSPLASPVHEVDLELARRVTTLLPSLVAIIQTTADPAKMEELLALNDSLTSLHSAITPGPPQPNGQPRNGSANHSENASTVSADVSRSPSPVSAPVETGNHVKANGGPPALSVIVEGLGGVDGEDEGPDPATPKIDKGKGKAEPEPEQLEKVLSPSFLISASDDEDEEGIKGRFVSEPEDLQSPSPNDRSVDSWIWGI